MTNTNPTSLNRRQALAGAGAVAGALAIVGPALAFGESDTKLKVLWSRYREINFEHQAATDAWRKAYKKLPEWCRDGDQYIDASGNPCGGNVGWPTIADGEPLELPDGRR